MAQGGEVCVFGEGRETHLVAAGAGEAMMGRLRVTRSVFQTEWSEKTSEGSGGGGVGVESERRWREEETTTTRRRDENRKTQICSPYLQNRVSMQTLAREKLVAQARKTSWHDSARLAATLKALTPRLSQAARHPAARRLSAITAPSHSQSSSPLQSFHCQSSPTSLPCR